MKKFLLPVILFVCSAFVLSAQTASPKAYLDGLKKEMTKKWPANRTVNIVFHGHSVPSGYSTGGVVRKMVSYPHLTLVGITSRYKYAVVNVITTSIGGENAQRGYDRFTRDVLPMNPDVIFIDYALNDRKMGLSAALNAWEGMVKKALSKGIEVVLMTPTPDTKENILDEEAPLAGHAKQIRALAKKYGTGLVDSYAEFKEMADAGEDLSAYMAQNNHPNARGHKVVAELIMEFFR